MLFEQVCVLEHVNLQVLNQTVPPCEIFVVEHYAKPGANKFMNVYFACIGSTSGGIRELVDAKDVTEICEKLRLPFLIGPTALSSPLTEHPPGQEYCLFRYMTLNYDSI